MKIITQNYIKPNNNIYYQKQNQNIPTNVVVSSDFAYSDVDYTKIPFGAMHNVKHKKLDVDYETNKLLKQMDEMLEADVSDLDIDDLISKTIQSSLSRLRYKEKRLDEIANDMELIANNKFLNYDQMIAQLRRLKKEADALEKMDLMPPKLPAQKVQDERIDYLLVNKFKNAIMEGNFNLAKINKEHYSNLENITTVEELHKQYPKIKVPQDPLDVIAKKIEGVLTRDFYLQLDKFAQANDPSQMYGFASDTVLSIVDELAKKLNVNPQKLYAATAERIHTTILDRYGKMRMEGSFTSVPEVRKNKFPQLTPNDIQMLKVDYDDFVLHVVKEHYLNGRKINEIKYDNGNTILPVSSLKDTDYKFGKTPEKVKGFVTAASAIRAAQRDYDNFDAKQFKDRLNYYASTEMMDNDDIFEAVVPFESCRFEDEDLPALAIILRELDKVQDEEQTLEQAAQNIKSKKLTPKGTEKLNKMEQPEAFMKLKEEQQKALQLRQIKDKFDDAINVLYFNNMANTANGCRKHRPKSLEPAEVKNAEFLIKTINEALTDETLAEKNKAKLETKILRWDTYNLYKETESSNIIFKKALSFATRDGKVDEDKAGQYILNSEIVKNYPKSLEFAPAPELLSKLMERADNPEDSVVLKLCKFDDYSSLSDGEKSHLSAYLDKFDMKDSLDKIVLKHIIENDYIVMDTVSQTKLYDTSDEIINATIGAKAKQQIYNKYKFPNCMEYLEGFEYALSSVAKDTNSSGIKKTRKSSNNCEYFSEIKLMGHDDRIVAQKDDFYFDKYLEAGMH